MEQKGIDCVLICNSPNLYYMTGYSPKKCERLQIAFVPLDSEPVMIVPALYRAHSEPECCFKDQRYWIDGVKLVAFTKDILAEKHLLGKKIAIDDTFEFFQMEVIRQANPNSTYSLGSDLFTEMRMRKDADEIALMLKSGQLSDEAVGMLLNKVLDGQSEAELKTWIEFELSMRGMTDGFSNLIAFGENTGSPHHVSGPRTLHKGEAFYLDIGGGYNHYWSDITRSFHVGKPSDRYIECYNRVREAQQLAFEYIKPGVRACDAHMVAWNYLDKYGLSEYFMHRLGHGVGMLGHELPNLSSDNQLILEPGMSFSCEPGVYFKGQWGIRIEDTIVVTETGAMSFNAFTKDLTIL
jgi:Xaa-Pro dipeptidase